MGKVSKENNFSWHKTKLISKSMLFCFINMAFQEQILRSAPRSSNFISFVQHIFISICGFATLGFNLRNSHLPIRYYLPLVFLNFFSVLSNSFAMNFGVSIPLNMIFKSSSLIANMLMGKVLLSHRYSKGKYFSVLLITSGLILCTLEDYRVKHSYDLSLSISNLVESIVNFNPYSIVDVFSSSATDSSIQATSIGILLLSVSLLLSAGTGIYQEYLARHHGKYPYESLFFVHLLSLPIFLITTPNDIRRHWNLFAGSINGPSEETIDTTLILYLVATVLSQYMCICSVYSLTTECASLTVTLCVTNRKFLSLLFSIFYFGNVFTMTHWIGSCVVFGGTLLFACVDLHWNNIRHNFTGQKRKVT